MCCHGGVVNAVLRIALRAPTTGGFELFTTNASLTELVLVRPGRWRLLRYNDAAHLAGLPLATGTRVTAWVVVGAGSAGCVVAGRLAEAGHDGHAGRGRPGRPRALGRGGELLRRAGRARAAVPRVVRARPGARRLERGQRDDRHGRRPRAVRGWGWHDAADALRPCPCPTERPGDDELGPVDRALLAAAPDAEVVTLTRRAGRRVTAADAYLAGRRPSTSSPTPR